MKRTGPFLPLFVIAIAIAYGLLISGCRPTVQEPAEGASVGGSDKQAGTFEPEAAAIIQSKCIGCHLAAYPAKGIVFEYNEAPSTPAEMLAWTIDIKRRWAGVTLLTQQERDILIEYGAELDDLTPPEQVYFTTVGGGPLSWPGIQIEDGLAPGNAGGWDQDGDFVALVNDRKWYREYDQVWFQPNAYWFFNMQDQRQHNFDISGIVYHASQTGIVFGVSELLPGDRKRRVYFEFRVNDDEWFIRFRDGSYKEEYYRGPWDGDIIVSKSKPLAYHITTTDNGDGTTLLSVSAEYEGSVIAEWVGVISREVVGKVGAADYAWGDRTARVSITYTADVVIQNTGVPE